MSRPFSTAEAATYLGYTEDSLRQLIHQGKIPYYKPSARKIYFRAEDLDAYCFRNRVAADYELDGKAIDILNGDPYGTPS